MRAALLALALTAAAGAGEAAAQARPGCPGDVALAASREATEFQSGGRTVRGLVYRPARSNGAGVVLLHGARGLSVDAPTFDPHAAQLASRGYHVLVPNYYDARAGQERRTSRDLRLWRRAAADGARSLEALPGVDPGRVALWGYSLGGFLAVEAAMEHDIAAAVSLAGGLDVGEAGRARRSVPLLLLHSRRDPVISPASTRAWGEGLSRRGAAVEVTELDWEGHGFDRPTWCTVFAASQAFLDRTLSVAPD